MRRRVTRGALGVLAALGVAGLGACSEIIGVADIPDASPEASRPQRDATTSHDGGVDGQRDATKDGRTSPDTGKDTAGGCVPNTTECSNDGLGVRTCGAEGEWSSPATCPADTPVCLGTSCSCVPGATSCNGQSFSRCVGPGPDGGALSGSDGGWGPGTYCEAGTCSLTGCGAPPPSCAPVGEESFTNGVSDCQSFADGTEGCCTSNEIPGGSFDLAYDGLAPYNVRQYAASVSGFRLDRYEVTVGRFRQFWNALTPDAGAWRPEPGSGKHTHLNGGQGLVDRAFDGGMTYESGWQDAWNADLDGLTKAPSPLQCGGASLYTWTTTPDVNEGQPINCLTWAEAYAFCIWDGGFLPSEAEWAYAAAGGSEQRYYPWSPDAGHIDTDAGCNNANFIPNGSVACGSATQAVGLTTGPNGGDSRWAQSDMAGNVVEWALDVSSGRYAPTCHDCALLTPPGDAGAHVTRVQRGGSFISVSGAIRNGVAGSDLESARSVVSGLRCARTP
jgi:sulfatase modifying factor 1